ncbi:MAG TPA: ABC transporter ATP-binding protein [Phycisphaerae bacterium]|nr:ABC transporter ATP-binding protein [Phycisphaerales bacterium]HRX84699.1 ABC transporter ATP-binding protein [Phycisphaerae bacterium]
MITLRDVAFHYPGGPFRLQVPALDVASGEKVALIGPSGSGKTSLLSIVCGLLRPDRGSVQIDGEELATLSEARRRAFRIRRIGFVFQEFELLEYLTVRENILLPYRLTDALTRTAQTDATLAELARTTGIHDKLKRYPRTLSQGEKQRVAICRALMTGPAVLAADEPTGNLDPATARDVLSLLMRQTEAHGATLIVVTHNHALLESFDRVIEVASWSQETAA